MTFLKRAATDRCRIFFASDIHGSERCWRKWLNAAEAYRADVLIFGGDLTGKAIVPIVFDGKRATAELHGKKLEAEGEAGLEDLRSRIRGANHYDAVLSVDEKRGIDENPDRIGRELFPRVVRESVIRWVELAEERLAKTQTPAHVILGNDDYPELRELLTGDFINDVEERKVHLPGDFEMVSLGYSNRTPWNSPRELDEEDLGARIEKLTAELDDPQSSVFNFHCPPRDTHLDKAPMVGDDFRPLVEGGQVVSGSVGSSAVRSAIESHQPMLGLHGHVHESPGVQSLGKTVVINAGSDYGNGVLRGAIVVLDRKKGVRSWQLVQG
jgi:uncharacterized protein